MLNNSLRNEKGSILILVAMLATTIILFAGLAVDTAIITNSKSQQRHSSEYMALAAIKAFNETTADPTDGTTATNNFKLESAKQRAQQIARENHFLGKDFLVHQGQEDIGDNLSSGAHGRIIPGIWYFNQGPTDCNLDLDGNPSGLPSPCPCDSPNSPNWATPCFRELIYSNANDLTPNAMRVELKTSSQSPIKNLFSSVAGNKSTSISASSTAVQLPRRIVFLIDLSRHSTNNTHLPYQIAANNLSTLWGNLDNLGFSGEYSYKPQQDCASTWDNLCPLSSSCNFFPSSVGNNSNNVFNTVYNGEFLAPPPLPARIKITDNLRATPHPLQISNHFKDDYQCFKVANHSDSLPDYNLTDSITPVNSFTNNDDYLADMHYDAATNYDGPEPLNTMISAVSTAIGLLRGNQIPNDEISVIGFDGSASIDIRTLGPFQINSSSLDPRGYTFEELENLSQLAAADPSHPNHLNYKQSRFVDHMFFPRITTDTLDLSKNIPEALKRAQEILTSAGNETSHNLVVLISDGLTNCFEDPTLSGATIDNPARICSNSLPGFLNSMDQVRDIIEQDYIANNIRFNFLQIGKRAGAHTLQRVKEEDNGQGANIRTCMTEDEAENSNPPILMQDPDFSLPANQPSLTEEEQYKKISYGEIYFPPSAEIALLARESGGKFVPIRDCCSPNPDGTCNDVTADINAECQASSANHGEVIQGQYADEQGRITCNPTSDTPRTQMQTAINEVFNINPYIIVD